MGKSIVKESHSPTTESLKEPWENTESLQLKILSTKLQLSDLTSRKPTTSCGPSNSEDQEEDSLKRGIPSKEEEIGETEKS